MVGQTRTVGGLAVIAASAALLVLAVGGRNHAQPPVPKAEVPKTKPSLVLALRSQQGLSKANIQEDFAAIAKYVAANNADTSKAKITLAWAKDPKILASTKGGFEQAQAWIQGRDPISLDESDGKSWLRRKSQTASTVFDLYTGDAGDDLEKLTVAFKDDGTKPVEFTLNTEVDKVKPLRFRANRGLYEFDTAAAKLPKDPLSYTLQVTRSNGEKGVVLGPIPWPQDNYAYWTVRLSDWEGELDTLVKLFADDRILPNTYDLSGTQVTTFGVGSALVDIETSDDAFDPSTNLFRFKVPGGKLQAKATTVWMRFPLSADDAKKEAAALNDPNLGGAGILAKIKEQGAVLLGDKLQLSPDMKDKPKWIELERTQGEFLRDVPVTETDNNAAKWKEKFTGPVFRLVVYEFNGGVIRFGAGGGVQQVKLEPVARWTFYSPEKAAPPK